MKKELLDKYFNEILLNTKGDNTSDKDIIDYENGQSITRDEIEKEYYNYLDLQEEIDNYIEENDLDDVFDKEKIIKHFSNINENCFKLDQAVLKKFTDYMSVIINAKNENIRKANMIFSKNGNGFLSTKITIPVGWARALQLTENDRECIIQLENNQIIISKADT